MKDGGIMMAIVIEALLIALAYVAVRYADAYSEGGGGLTL